MDIARIARTRHTCKAYDASRKIPADQIEQLKTLLRFAPSSVNSQPWHFFIAETDAGKARIANSTPEGSPYAANLPKVKNASHVVALCARTNVDDAHIEIEVEAGLPDAYVAQQAERLKLYRELDSTKDEAALQALLVLMRTQWAL